MEPIPTLDPQIPEDQVDQPIEDGSSLLETDYETPKLLTFWRGLQTVLGAAFIVATLFTLWTPGSLIEGSLEARMVI